MIGMRKNFLDFLVHPNSFYYLCRCLAVDGWQCDAGSNKVHGLAYFKLKDVY